MLAQALGLRAKIADAIAHWGGVEAYGAALRARLGLAAHETVAAVEEARDQMSQLRNQTPTIQVDAGKEIIIFFGDTAQ